MHHLPVHPYTGLTAVGIVGGRPVWPILGGSGDTPPPSAAPAGQPTPTEPPSPTPAPTGQPPTAGDPPKNDEFKSEESKRAVLADLAKEREERKRLAGQLEKLAPLEKLAAALGASGDPETGPTDIEKITERLTKHETELAGERQARWRAEIANEKGLTIEQAARLQGDSKDALAADADALKALFPTAPPAPGTPRPDPSQGGQGGNGANLDAQIAEANKKGDWRTVLSLQNQKLANAKP
jgi:hypothetical protein